VHVINEGGRHVTISWIFWKWLRVWINFGYPRAFIWGTCPKQPWDIHEVRDLTPILNALDIDTGPLVRLLLRIKK
jgi:hypothetical protein